MTKRTLMRWQLKLTVIPPRPQTTKSPQRMNGLSGYQRSLRLQKIWLSLMLHLKRKCQAVKTPSRLSTKLKVTKPLLKSPPMMKLKKPLLMLAQTSMLCKQSTVLMEVCPMIPMRPSKSQAFPVMQSMLTLQGKKHQPQRYALTCSAAWAVKRAMAQ